jgi:tagatose-1,6-bisphosphate aldolase
MKREMATVRSTNDQVSQQKKDYIKKMMTEMDNMRDQLETVIAQESMAKEEYYSRCAWYLKDNLKIRLDNQYL